MDLQQFHSLSARQRALTTIAVLLDGFEAPLYLKNDAEHGELLGKIAEQLGSLSPELRMPLVGTLLRSALEELVLQSAGD